MKEKHGNVKWLSEDEMQNVKEPYVEYKLVPFLCMMSEYADLMCELAKNMKPDIAEKSVIRFYKVNDAEEMRCSVGVPNVA